MIENIIIIIGFQHIHTQVFEKKLYVHSLAVLLNKPVLFLGFKNQLVL